MRVWQLGHFARHLGAAGHQPAYAHAAPRAYRYIDEWDPRRSETQSPCCCETDQRVAKATTATAAGFASSLSRLSLPQGLRLCSETPSHGCAALLLNVSCFGWKALRHSDLMSSTSPNCSQLVPLQRCSCSCVQIMLLVALVLIEMPGIAVGSTRSFRLFACLTIFSRDRSLPHCFRICSRIMPC